MGGLPNESDIFVLLKTVEGYGCSVVARLDKFLAVFMVKHKERTIDTGYYYPDGFKQEVVN